MASGRIRWCQSLRIHLKELIDSVTSHPVLSIKPQTVDIIKRFEMTTNHLKLYEEDMLAIWMDQNVSRYSIALKNSLIICVL